MKDCIFCQIASGEITSRSIEDEGEIVVFPSNSPEAPIHLLFVPKTHIGTFLDASDQLVAKISALIQQKVKKLGLKEKSYRIIVNGGKAQEVPHLHFHLLGEVV